MHAVTVKGVVGGVKHGWHHAAAVGDWTVTKTETGWSLVATIRSSDVYRIAQRPLTFEAKHATGAWRWPVRELQISGATLMASLGPLEK